METLINYNVKLIKFPNSKVHESVIENEDGSYTIFIDSSLVIEQQKKYFLHAMNHICNKDFEKEDANIIEYNSHIMKSCKRKDAKYEK